MEGLLYGDCFILEAPFAACALFVMRNKLSQQAFWNWAVNGLIPLDVCLSCALRYFAGGDPYNISLAHGISRTEVYTSVWRIVDADKCVKLGFSFPECNKKQREVAQQFWKKSAPGLSCCVRGQSIGCLFG